MEDEDCALGLEDERQEEATQPTQPATQLVEDPRRYGEQSNEFSEFDLADIICILHPASMLACKVVSHIHQYSPELTLSPAAVATHTDDSHTHLENQQRAASISPDSFKLASEGLAMCDLVLRFSAPQKNPRGGFTFGRHSGKSDFVLFDDTPGKPRISNAHFRIYMSEQSVLMVEDTSTNGTVVDNSLLHTKEKLAINPQERTPIKRTIQNGSIISFIPPTETSPVIKFIVRIPLREGLDEDRYDANLTAYVAKYYSHSHVAFSHANKVLAERHRRNNNEAPDIFARDAKPQISAHGSRRRAWHGGEKYNKQEVLGKGAFATVYKVTTKVDGTVYAAKELDKRKFMKNGVLDVKVENEMKIMRTIKHPNIVEFIEPIDYFDKLYLIMEYIPGGDLGGQIAMGHLLTEGGAMLMSLQMIGALQYIHSHGITHRDVKPDNILLVSKEPFHAKLSDFGLSKMILDGEEMYLTTFCGTLLYCAPEVYSESREYDLETGLRTNRGAKNLPPQRYTNVVDVWSLGCVLFHAMTGKPPFPAASGTTYLELLQSIMTGHANFRLILKKGHSWGAVNFLGGMLIKKPEDRSSLEELGACEWLDPARSVYSSLLGEEELEEVDMVDDPQVDGDLAYDASQLSLDNGNGGEGQQFSHDSSEDDDDDLDFVPHTQMHSSLCSSVAGDSNEGLSDSAFLSKALQEGGRLFGEIPPEALQSSGAFPLNRMNTTLSVRDSSLQRKGFDDTDENNSFDLAFEDNNSPDSHGNSNLLDANNASTIILADQNISSTQFASQYNTVDSLHSAASLFGAESMVGHMQVGSPFMSQAPDSALMPPPTGMKHDADSDRHGSPVVRHEEQNVSPLAVSRRRSRDESSNILFGRALKRPATFLTMSQAHTPAHGQGSVLPTIETQSSTADSANSTRSTASRSNRSIKPVVHPELFWDPRDRSTYKQDTYGITGDEIHEMLDEARARGEQFFSNSPSFFEIRDSVRARSISRSVVPYLEARQRANRHSEPTARMHMIAGVSGMARSNTMNSETSANEKKTVLPESLDPHLRASLTPAELLQGTNRTHTELFAKSFTQNTGLALNSSPSTGSRADSDDQDDAAVRSTSTVEITTNPIVSPANTIVAAPLPLESPREVLAVLRSSVDSCMKPLVLKITDPVTVWGRGTYTNPTYWYQKEIRVPKYAFKLALWKRDNTNDPYNHDGERFYISAKNSAGIYINSTHIPAVDPSKPFTPSIHWTELFHGDQITFYKVVGPGSGLQINTFRFDCKVGVSRSRRPGGNAGLVRTFVIGPIQQQLDKWVLAQQMRMYHHYELHKDTPGYIAGLKKAFFEHEKEALEKANG